MLWDIKVLDEWIGKPSADAIAEPDLKDLL
jgi:hypothetical protein